ncbi:MULTISPECIES: hypothetical protein [Aerococcus]|uniref:Uncharacterized protein n=2 Tax=Aerococcus TaxID=1375 RepID=A0A178HIV0_9LACT|nr:MULTISPECIES: hypothetical protein [Aerococcus]KAA9218697.1 hypothetical protein F6I39_06700 [Aerococcus loyolae]KAA9265000.1 hypothetical protein F6I19_05750 [Aerococcus loyolae]MCY3025848.1 hypothetical protein [Aerococcus loyolae]MCY3027699.1 hypothetical protein [Aerococcus loyolae]MCY3029604.1 hypothetical protein [Aerococcus loyolae]
MDNLKKLFLAAVGGTSLTLEKAQEMIKQAIDKGQITVQEGKELTEDLKRSFTDRAHKQSLSEQIESLQVQVDNLSDQVNQLSEKLNEI